MSSQPMVEIEVCICTFRRPEGLARLLVSLEHQSHAPLFRVRVIDNDDVPSAQACAAAAAARGQLRLDYCHVPGRNIASARNAALAAVRAPLLAFVDDDESVPADWLQQLHAALLAHPGWAAVFAPVRAVYAADAPRWMRKGGFHDKQPLRRNGRGVNGHTANVLMRTAPLAGQYFDPALGRTGGEDLLFFRALERSGAILGYCADARVDEVVEADRLSLRWLCRRAYVSGHIHVRVERALAQRRGFALRLGLPAACKVLYCCGGALLQLASPVAWRRSLLRAALHAGVLLAVLGWRAPESYGQAGDSSASKPR